jgi:hypothetical protein
MIDKICIYEVHYSNINRYVIPLSKYLIEKKVTGSVDIIYDSFVEKEKIDSIQQTTIRHLNAKQCFEEIKSQSLGNYIFINYSFRIVDLYWTYKFKKIGVYTAQIQHGMYAEFLERSLKGYFSTIGRKWVYLKYLMTFFVKGKTNIGLYLFNKDFLKSFRINRYLENKAKHSIRPVLSDHLFIWGNYWKNWFIKNHFYDDNTDFTVIGNPDYHTFIKGSKELFDANKVCYIAQTFVEDGRMDEVEYEKIIAELADGLGDRLIVKRHPRSFNELYTKVIENGGKLTNGFPLCGFYIGHYSSVLALAINIKGSKVSLLRVNNEEIPMYFSNSANKVYNRLPQLIDDIVNDRLPDAQEDISFYFENKETNPYDIIIEGIQGRIN